MYTPPPNVVHEEQAIRAMVAAWRSGWLVTTGENGMPAATLLPLVWRDDAVIMHMAKGNVHWRGIGEDSPALVIVTGPEAYITPSWYATKAEHGKVVPTWNYSAVHLTGTVRVHQDREWLRRAVTDLTDLHEAGREHSWRVTDAPAGFIDAQLNGIVGIELTVTGAEGKAKLSQNRSDADRAGVIAGLRTDSFPAHDAAAARAVADAMSAH